LQAQVARAGRDDSIKGVVFEVDSFGGEVAGAFETARVIGELSAQKPTLAILTDFALSAGYLMASAARQIVMPDTGAAGSIGVITMHADFSKQLENRGIKVTLISSGVHKTDGHPAAALADDVRENIQARVDRSRALFAATVAEFRGKRLDKKAAMSTEAQVFHGEDAVNAGLVDGIIDPQKAFSAFLSKV
jgi:signal peptide peptidase SppA